MRTLPRVVIGATCLAASVAAAADAPRIVKAVPDNGDANVDPNLKELRVEFDQDMNTGGHSICGGGDNFPEITGRPRWEKRRTIIVPIRLKPNHTYSLGINCPAAQNFRSAGGEAVEPYFITFTTGDGSESEAKKLTREQNAAAIEALRKAIDERYSHRDLHKVNWAAEFKEHEQAMLESETPAEFGRAAAKLLAPAKDVHVIVFAGETAIATHRRGVTGNYNTISLNQKVPNWKKHNDLVCSGRFDDGIGYVMVASWSPAGPADLEPLYEALSDFADAKGIIIDVRPNGGGDEVAARDFAGCFVVEPAVYSKNDYRDPSRPGGFGEVHERVVEPKKGRPSFRGKVAVLIGPANISSCESFILMMRHGANARLFGDRTGGSSGNPKRHDLGNGVAVTLPSWRDMLPDGTMLEGKGIQPDESVKATPADFARGDPVLDAALKWLRS